MFCTQSNSFVELLRTMRLMPCCRPTIGTSSIACSLMISLHITVHWCDHTTGDFAVHSGINACSDLPAVAAGSSAPPLSSMGNLTSRVIAQAYTTMFGMLTVSGRHDVTNMASE